MITGAVAHLFLHRVRRRWPALLGIGVVVGIGFGLGLASFAAARQTSSAFGRMLAVSDAEDATISHTLPVAEAERVFASIDIVDRTRHAVGFVGFADGLDPAVARGFIAAAAGVFPFSLPVMSDGRLPDQSAANEVFVNTYLAERGGVGVGDELSLTFFTSDFSSTVSARVEVVGVGAFPREVVVDETATPGIMVLTTAFANEHEEYVIYRQTSVDLVAGADAESDLPARVALLGFEVQESQAQVEDAVNQALRPLHVVVVAVGVLAFVATLVLAAQMLQRERERWRSADRTLVALGFVRSQIVLLHVAAAASVALTAVVVALVAMWLVSPIAPVGPLHDFDPAQGPSLDAPVAVLGVLTIVVVVLALGAACALTHGSSAPSRRRGGAALPVRVRHPSVLAGLTLALSGTSARRRSGRSIAAAAIAIGLTAFVGVVVVSAATLNHSPTRYGFEGDVLGLNPYGDQPLEELEAMFGADEQVVAATGYQLVTLLVNGQSVPGIAATHVKGDRWPTVLRGAVPRAADEIVLGEETLGTLGADVGDTVSVQIVNFDGRPTAATRAVRVAGTATFAPVVQPGYHHARLGVGALISRAGYEELAGDPRNEPEWTVLTLADGVDPHEFIARHPAGIPDRLQIATSWFTDAKPAELRQLASVMGMLAGAVVVAYLVVVAVLLHALWSQARASRRVLAILQAVGLTRRQLGSVVGWQALPIVAMSTLVGAPIGIVLGRWAFSVFARSFDVVDDASTPVGAIAVLVGAALVAGLVGHLAARAVAARVRTALVLRQH